MQKIYVITRGEYSDYGIERVFSTREAAEKYCAVDTDKYDEPMIEEYDLEDGSNIQIDRMYKAIFFQLTNMGLVYWLMKYGLSPFPTDIQLNREEKNPYNLAGKTVYEGISGWIPVTEIPTDDEKIEKMVRDRVAKWKAEQNGLC